MRLICISALGCGLTDWPNAQLMPTTICSIMRQVFMCMQDGIKLIEGRTVYSVGDRGLTAADAGLVTAVHAALSAEAPHKGAELAQSCMIIEQQVQKHKSLGIIGWNRSLEGERTRW